MKAAIGNAIPYHDHLFVSRGFEVMLYITNGDDLKYETSFTFPDVVQRLTARPFGLIVETNYSLFVILGGPTPATYFSHFLVTI